MKLPEREWNLIPDSNVIFFSLSTLTEKAKDYIAVMKIGRVG